MTDHEFPFVHTLLEARLQNHLKDALRFVSTLSEEDVLQCDNACLTEIIRQFAVAAPVLRTDNMETDKRIIESTDLVSEQTTGHSLHSVFVPVEREARWLEEVDRQTAPDGKPLAFLDRERNRIVMRLVVAPEDGEGTLKRKVDDRKSPLEQYGASVTEKIIDFNKELTARMAAALEGRKTTIAKGRTEQEKVGLPQVHSPEHEEMVLLIERIQKNLGVYVKAPSADSRVAEVGEVRTFIVHGHDHQSALELKDYLQNTLDLGEPVILRQTPSAGKTIIEKFEHEAESIELVFVLLTPDDEGASLADPNNVKRRVRQNVILELGFFLGTLGRKSGRVLLLYKEGTELPSDIYGIEYIDITYGVESAGEKIRRELQRSGVLK